MTTPGTGPQKFDSVVRTLTTSLLAVMIVGSLLYMLIAGKGDPATVAPLLALASVIVGFYFGVHTAQNTATLEEARLSKAADASEASAVRSEAASQPTTQGEPQTRE